MLFIYYAELLSKLLFFDKKIQRIPIYLNMPTQKMPNVKSNVKIDVNQTTTQTSNACIVDNFVVKI